MENLSQKKKNVPHFAISAQPVGMNTLGGQSFYLEIIVSSSATVIIPRVSQMLCCV